MTYGWDINLTLINWQRLRFTGRGAGLFGLRIKSLLLIAATLGVYSVWANINLTKPERSSIRSCAPS